MNLSMTGLEHSGCRRGPGSPGEMFLFRCAPNLLCAESMVVIEANAFGSKCLAD